MSDVREDNLTRLRIAPEQKARRKSGPVVLLLIVLLLVLGGGLALIGTRKSTADAKKPEPVATAPAAPTKAGDSILTVTGYVIPRARIEISPKFMATVKTINVKKGDVVKKDTVIVELEDDEYRARLLEAQGRLAQAEANLANAEINLKQIGRAHV